MYAIPPHCSSVTMTSRGGASYHFASLESAVRVLGFSWLIRNLGTPSEMHHPYLVEGWGAPHFEYKWVMTTSFGEVVTCAAIERFRAKFSKQVPAFKVYAGSGPVPGISRPRHWHYCRRVRHMNERRQAAAVLAEYGEIPPRGRRNTANLPNPYDDYLVASREDRSWKKFRKTRWKS